MSTPCAIIPIVRYNKEYLKSLLCHEERMIPGESEVENILNKRLCNRINKALNLIRNEHMSTCDGEDNCDYCKDVTALIDPINATVCIFANPRMFPMYVSETHNMLLSTFDRWIWDSRYTSLKKFTSTCVAILQHHVVHKLCDELISGKIEMPEELLEYEKAFVVGLRNYKHDKRTGKLKQCQMCLTHGIVNCMPLNVYVKKAMENHEYREVVGSDRKKATEEELYQQKLRGDEFSSTFTKIAMSTQWIVKGKCDDRGNIMECTQDTVLNIVKHSGIISSINQTYMVMDSMEKIISPYDVKERLTAEYKGYIQESIVDKPFLKGMNNFTKIQISTFFFDVALKYMVDRDME